MFKKLKLSTFTGNILKVLSGNIVGQTINIITIPIIARLFTKEVLGLNELFISVISTLFITSSFRYESAIVVAEDDAEEEGLFVLSSLILIVFSTLLTIILFLFSDKILSIFQAEKLKNIFYIIVLGVFLKGFQQIGQRILIRNGKFKKLSFSYVSEVGFNKITSVIIGHFYNIFSVLWSCYLLGTFISLFFIFSEIRKFSLSNIDRRKIIFLLKKYKKFPLFNNLSNFLNNFSIQLPILLISSKFGLEFVALYGYANRIISLPINLMASSIAKVYYQEAAAKFNEDKKSLKKLYISIQKKLILIGLSVVIGIQLFATPVVNLFLGPEWISIIPILRMMTIFVFFRFLCNPVASTFTVINKQEIGLIIVIFSILIRFLTLTMFNLSFQSTVLIYSIVVSTFYIFYNLLMFRVMSKVVS